MRLKHRVLIVASGSLIALYGFGMLHRGEWAYRNSYSMTLYSPGVIAIGVFWGLLAFLPSPRVLNKLAGRGKRQDH